MIDDFHPIILNTGKATNLVDWNFNGISSPFARIYYIIEEGAFLKINGSIIQLTPNHLYLIPPFELHDTICHNPFSHYYLHLYEDPSSNKTGSIFDNYLFPREVPADKIIIECFEKLITINSNLTLSDYNPKSYNNTQSLMQSVNIEQAHDISIRLETRAIILLLLARFFTKATNKQFTQDAIILKSINYIYSNLSNQNLNVQSMADYSCLSVNQFIRRFRKEIGVTPNQFLIDKRIEKAQLLLLNNELNNKDIAYAVGYDDPAYFVKSFKRKVGISPQKYKILNTKKTVY